MPDQPHTAQHDKPRQALSAPAGSEEFVKAVLHRCVDLGWRDADLVRAAKISKANWSAVRNYKTSPTIETVVKVCRAVGLEWKFSLTQNMKGTPCQTCGSDQHEGDNGVE